MASMQNHFCDICVESHVVAVVWCPDCEEFLCPECSKHHSRAKISRDHTTITVADYKKLPPSFLSIRYSCSDHNEKFEFYCPFHKHPCCVKCVNETHVDCRNLVPLHDAIKGAKTENGLLQIDQELRSVQKSLNDIYENCSSNLQKLEKQKKTSCDEIVNIRHVINQRLDKLEGALQEELEEKYVAAKTKTGTLLSDIMNQRGTVNGVIRDLEIIKKVATGFQIFMIVSEIENTITERVQYLEELHEAGSLDELNLQLNVDPALMSFMKNAFSFGTISYHHNPISLDILSLQGEHAETIVRPSNTIDKIKLIPKQRIQLPKSENVTGITGCEILNDGQLLFVDFDNKRLLSADSQSKSNELMKLSSSPRDIAIVDKNTVAITLRDDQTVVLIDVKASKIVKTFNVTSPCYGIDRVEDKLVVRLNHIGQFLVLNLKGKILSRLHISGYYIQDVALFDGKIFCTNCEDHHVYCYDMNGDLLWKYADENLRKPFGIGEDSHGNIYVAGRETNNVLLISPDGHRTKELLTSKHGLCDPYALHVNKTTNQLLVCNEFGGQAFLFDIAN